MSPAGRLFLVPVILAVEACARHPFYGAPKAPVPAQSDRSQRPESPLPPIKPHTVVPPQPHPDQPRSPDAHVPRRGFGGR